MHPIRSLRSLSPASMMWRGMLAATLLVTAADDAVAQKGDGPGALDFANPVPRATEFVKVERGGNIGKIKRVGIVNFTVEFALAREVTTVREDPFQTSVTTTRVKMQIPQVDPATLQAIVDGLYADVQADLRGMGMELIPYEELKATKAFGKLDDAMHASPWATSMKNVNSVLLAPSGMSVYLDNIARADFRKSLGFTFGTNTRLHEIRMVNELKNDAYLLSVNMVVDFKKVTEGRRSITIEDALHVVPEGTLYRFVSKTQPMLSLVELKAPVVSTANLWSSLSESEAKTERGMNVRRSSSETVGVFDANAYVNETKAMFAAVRKMFTAQMVAAK